MAFGTLVQLVLENAPEDEIAEVLDFCMEVGLPVTLADLGIKEVKADQIMEVAKLAAGDVYKRQVLERLQYWTKAVQQDEEKVVNKIQKAGNAERILSLIHI